MLRATNNQVPVSTLTAHARFTSYFQLTVVALCRYLARICAFNKANYSSLNAET